MADMNPTVGDLNELLDLIIMHKTGDKQLSLHYAPTGATHQWCVRVGGELELDGVLASGFTAVEAAQSLLATIKRMHGQTS